MNETTPAPGVAARSLALMILHDVERGAFSDRLLQRREDWLDDPRDRRLLHLLVLGTLRWQPALDRALAPLVTRRFGSLSPDVRNALRVGLFEASILDRPPPMAVSIAVSACRARGADRGAGLVNAVLRRALSSGAPDLDPRESLPSWLGERWSRRFGADEAGELAEALTRPPRPFLVVRPDRGGRDLVARTLAEEGVVTAPSALHPWGLEVKEGVPQRTAPFSDGSVVAMDAAAAMAAAIAAPSRPGPVADVAAAPGGKSSVLAQLADGPLVAMDLVDSRTKTLAGNVVRTMPAGRVAVVRGSVEMPPLKRDGFASVLLDAPCSGSGTLRRRPEIRMRLAPADVASCAAAQKTMLECAAGLVAPGGAFVYSVCSLEPEEGSERVEEFLQEHPEFQAVDPRKFLEPAAREFVTGRPGYLETKPHRGELDGFFAARLEKRCG